LPDGRANIPSMIGVDNQVGRLALVWLERVSFTAGGLGVAGLGALRIVSGAGLDHPHALWWAAPSAALAAGCALLYWRVITRMPQSPARRMP
jgi:hypothetical protein